MAFFAYTPKRNCCVLFKCTYKKFYDTPVLKYSYFYEYLTQLFWISLEYHGSRFQNDLNNLEIFAFIE